MIQLLGENIYYSVRTSYYSKRTKGIAWLRLIFTITYRILILYSIYFLYRYVGYYTIKTTLYDALFKYSDLLAPYKKHTTIYDVWYATFGQITGVKPPKPQPPIVIVKPKPEPFSYYGFTKKVLRKTGDLAIFIVTDETCVNTLAFIGYMAVIIYLGSSTN
jgi:hypothetical protein